MSGSSSERADLAGYPAAGIRRRHRLESSGNGGEKEMDAWVMTYMDVITLMLTLFVLLLSYADKKDGSYEEVSRELAKAAGAESLIELAPPPSLPIDLPSEEMAVELESLAKRIEGIGLEEGVDVERTPEGLKIQLSEKVLFGTGEARLRPRAFEVLRPIVTQLQQGEPFEITVEGHTDNVPISTPQFPSNWELSTARAAYVVRYLIGEGINERRVSAAGFADTRPRADNVDEEGRRRNRRVTLVISNKSIDLNP